MFLSEIFGNLFTQAGSLVVTVFWIWMLIDCATNKAIRSKTGWMLLLFFTQIVGAIIYFASGRAYTPALLLRYLKKLLSSSPTTPRYTSAPYRNYQRDEGYQQNNQTYQQGYQAYQPPPPAYTTPEAEQAASQDDYAEYEQPQATYPEMPQQQENSN